jgi:transcription elongation GreA/GreB family factor
MEAIDKRALFEALRRQVSGDLERLEQSQRATVEGATHEEARPENDKDTRALESTYLARGLAERVAALENASRALSALKLRDFGGDDPVALGALVALEGDEGGARYFVVPAAGGRQLEHDGVTVKTVTPEAPLGRALLGSYLGDEVRVRTPQGVRELELVEVA